MFLEKVIAYQREFLALKERLRIAEHRISQRSSELSAIVQQFKRVEAETNRSKDPVNKFSGTGTVFCLMERLYFQRVMSTILFESCLRLLISQHLLTSTERKITMQNSFCCC